MGTKGFLYQFRFFILVPMLCVGILVPMLCVGILVPMLCVGTSFFLYIIPLFHHLIIP